MTVSSLRAALLALLFVALPLKALALDPLPLCEKTRLSLRTVQIPGVLLSENGKLIIVQYQEPMGEPIIPVEYFYLTTDDPTQVSNPTLPDSVRHFHSQRPQRTVVRGNFQLALPTVTDADRRARYRTLKGRPIPACLFAVTDLNYITTEKIRAEVDAWRTGYRSKPAR